jgi:hypothetical protein
MARTSTFRRLWQPPPRYEDRPSERRVTFLELFFDLVLLVVISLLAHRLAEHPSWSGVGWFVFVFYAVWSSWTIVSRRGFPGLREPRGGPDDQKLVPHLSREKSGNNGN